MYPLAHLYFAQKALIELEQETVLGSIFPDVVFFSGFDWYYSHSLGGSLWRNFRRDSEGMASFCRGVISHGIDPQGLDYYSDEQYRDYEKGYCYEKARPLVDGVVKACNIAPGDGWWKAHNFIEMGVELFVFDLQPELLSLLHRALSHTLLIRKICIRIAPFLQVKPDLLERGYLFFKVFVERGPMDARSLALRYQEHIFLRYGVVSVNLNQCQDIIERGKALIMPDVEIFFDEVKETMAPLWQG